MAGLVDQHTITFNRVFELDDDGYEFQSYFDEAIKRYFDDPRTAGWAPPWLDEFVSNAEDRFESENDGRSYRMHEFILHTPDMECYYPRICAEDDEGDDPDIINLFQPGPGTWKDKKYDPYDPLYCDPDLVKFIKPEDLIG